MIFQKRISKILRTRGRLQRSLSMLGVAFALLAPGSVSALSIERVVSAGGIEAWLARDKSVPVISVKILFRGSGSAVDPEGKEGLAHLVSGLLDEGAGPLDSQHFRQALEENAISLRFDAGRDDFSGSLKTLRENREMAFDLLRLALVAPRFDKPAIERIRNQVLTSLAHLENDPNAIAQRIWLRTAFPDHAYGKQRRGTEKSLHTIDAPALRDFARRHLARENLIVGVAGDISPAELGPLLDQTFGALPARPKNKTPLGDAVVKGKGDVTVIEKPIPQSVITFGQIGVKRTDPDYYAAYVMTHLLGGGMGSRLMKEIREKRGLAYYVYSTLQPLDRVGLLMGRLATRNDRAAFALGLVRAEWKRMAETRVSKTELADAKTYLTGAFPLSLDSTSRVAGVLIAIQKNRLGIDYLTHRNAYIAAVTVEDVARVARRLLKPDALNVVIVGKPEGLTSPAPATE